MDNNVFCPICGYNFICLEADFICPQCKTDLNGTLYKTYEGKFIYRGLMSFQMHDRN